MSNKNLKFIDRLRSKSFDRAIISGNNLASYHYIENFDNITEEECLRLDSQNKEIYKKNMDLYENISKQIEHKNAMFKINSPPLPPSEPNNYDRFIASRLRNVSRNVRYQSYAIQYLLNKGYKLIFEQKSDKEDFEFESHDAIDICEKIEGLTIDNLIKRDYPNSVSNKKNINTLSMIPPGYVSVYPQNIQMYNNYLNHNSPSPTLSSPSPSTSPPNNQLFSYIQHPPIKNTQVINGPPASHFMNSN